MMRVCKRRLIVSLIGLSVSMVACSCGPTTVSIEDSFDPNAYQISSPQAMTLSAVHNCVLKDGDIWCWGSDYAGESTASGERRDDDQLVPFHVLPGHKFKTIGSTSGATFGIKEDGTLWSWGLDNFGQLGAELSADASDFGPHQIGEDDDWKFVRGASSNAGACAIKTNGSLWCWGDNRLSQLGIGGSTTYEGGPRQVGTDVDWLDVDMGIVETCGVKVDQSLWCWGKSSAIESNSTDDGMFNGVTTNLPTAVLPSKKMRSVSLDGGNGCALTVAGELYCWGTNDGGQLLGLELLPEQHTIRKFATNDDWVKVAMPGSALCALKIDGTVECWGANSGGALGRGLDSDELRMSQEISQVVTEQRFVDIDSGTFGFFAMTGSGDFYGWGSRHHGGMGKGIASRENPVPVKITFE